MGLRSYSNIFEQHREDRYIPYPDGYNIRRDIPALPFYRHEKRVQKRKKAGYPEHPLTIGEHIRKVRMDKGLLQEDVAALVGTTTDSITNWENGRGTPQIQYNAKIIAFLGYNPFVTETVTLGDRIKAYRQQEGLSHERFAKLIGVDSSTISCWENDENVPQPKSMKLLKQYLE